tara:strand:+ start:1276 stop:1875 length:600 start_codon:yes stop_codon:yes gene_type:complete
MEKENEKKLEKREKKRLKAIKKLEGYPDRGIETWFKLASKNLYTRRQIVDTKSNILITINAIILSVVLGSLYPKLDDDPHLLWGIIPMVLTNVISIAYATVATRPKMSTGVFTKQDIESKTSALMTFDDFYKMSLEDYEHAIGELMQNGTFLYRTITRDIHRLGVDLSKRYKNIQIAYNVFLTGLIISVIVFGLCHMIF